MKTDLIICSSQPIRPKNKFVVSGKNFGPNIKAIKFLGLGGKN